MAEHVHRDRRPSAGPWRSHRPSSAGSSVQLSSRDIQEDRRGAGVQHRIGRGGEGEIRHQHLVADADAGEAQREIERRRTVDDGNAMGAAGQRRPCAPRTERRPARPTKPSCRATQRASARRLGVAEVGNGQRNARGGWSMRINVIERGGRSECQPEARPSGTLPP